MCSYNYILVHENKVVFEMWIFDDGNGRPCDYAESVIAGIREEYPGAVIYVRVRSEYPE